MGVDKEDPPPRRWGVGVAVGGGVAVSPNVRIDTHLHGAYSMNPYAPPNETRDHGGEPKVVATKTVLRADR